jgi:hypothetical protein
VHGVERQALRFVVDRRLAHGIAASVEQGLLLVAGERGTVVATVTLYLEPQPTSGNWRPDDAMIRFLAVSADHVS